MNDAKILIRWLEESDIKEIARAFESKGGDNPAARYDRFYREQANKARDVYIAFSEGQFAGYLTICWTSNYRPFREENIPEIADFTVLPKFREQGIGRQLLEKAESEIAKVSQFAGIGVGMDPDYGPAQRLYVKRGYIPDGRGLHYRGHCPAYGEKITMGDDVALYLTKKLR